MSDTRMPTKRPVYSARGLALVGPKDEILTTFSTNADAIKAAGLINQITRQQAKRVAPDLQVALFQVGETWYIKSDGGNGPIPASHYEVELWKALQSRRAAEQPARKSNKKNPAVEPV